MAVLLLAAAKLVVSGLIGQSQGQEKEPIDWTDCAWCVTDVSGDVHFPGGWKMPSGGCAVVREDTSVLGEVFSDGEGNLYYFYPQRAELGIAIAGPQGLFKGRELTRLYHWDLRLHAAPVSCSFGFAADGRRFFALDRKRREVHAWADGGEDAGVVLSFAERKEPFVSLAIHPQSGDLLLGTGWPENKICRFRSDGTEVKDPFWPASGYALSLATSGGRVWVLGSDAALLSESKAVSAQCRFGRFSNVVRALAETSDGFWLATSQGAQFYHKNDLGRCARRVGGLRNVTAMAALDGRLLVCDGYRMLNFWMDDRPGDIISSADTDHVARNWNEVVDKIEVRDGIFYLNESKQGRVIAYDPRVTEWVFRNKRLYDVTNVTVRADNRRVRLGIRHAVWAREDALQLYERGEDRRNRLVQTLPYAATHLAASGDWLFAYVPERKAILRFKFEENGK